MKKFVVFVVVGFFAVAASLAAFYLALRSGMSPREATVARLVASFPILYVGYSRFMLVENLRLDQRTIGPARAEARMALRIVLAIASSVTLKLIVEPILTTWLLAHFGRDVASLSPLAGDFVYGPIATYTVLTLRASIRA